MASDIAEGLERVVQVMAQKGFPVADSLKPGLSEHEIRERVAHLPFRLPGELYELYQWHNGQSQECRLYLFRDLRFLSLEEALDDYQMIQAYFVPALGGVDVGVDLRTCFPFAGFEGANYVLPCRGQTLREDCELPVIIVFEGIEVHFLSFSTMIDTIAAWHEAGAHKVDAPFVDQKLELRIWKQYNPGLFQ